MHNKPPLSTKWRREKKNHAFHINDVVQMEGDARDPTLRDLQHMWMEEVLQAGVAGDGS